jgi:hypothetical protein
MKESENSKLGKRKGQRGEITEKENKNGEKRSVKAKQVKLEEVR